ncbi:thiamine phosphate synthase [Natranaerobius trueperi]|uniref:thiamine phosphate synthase n=1 Tax=Natranaerobius trueperi TaxID=759412 RepID=UPI00197BFE9D|nr:thiamine phosphate synthase [Natranaerobius trueperi]
MNNSSNILNTDIYAITAEEFSKGRDNIQVVTEMLESGVEIIQYREKNKTAKEKLEQCKKIRELTYNAGCKFIVNDDIDIAILVDACGVHVGQNDLPIKEVRKLVGNEKIIGKSTHAPKQAHKAVEDGADYIGTGPVFQTDTKEKPPVGTEYVEYVAKNLDIPFVAIGGIKKHNLNEVKNKGATCFAMVTEIVGAVDISQQIKELRSIITS